MVKEEDDAIEGEGTVDDTATKAADIGKDLGVTKEEIPDYDIQEEADERIAKSRNDAGSQKPLREKKSAKEKREQRKDRWVKTATREKDALIAQQQQQIDELSQRAAQIEGRLAGVDKGQVKAALADTMKVFNDATLEHTEAFKDGDGTKATLAMRKMYDAQKRLDQLQALDQRLDKQPVQQQQVQKPRFDASVVSHAKDWATRNAWFKQDENGQALDEDSEIATALSARLVKEGFDPKSEDFWDELEERVQKRLPHVAASQEEDEDFQDDDKPAVQAPRKRAAPPVGGGANRGDVRGKVAVQVSTAFLDELKKNGLYEDPKIRNEMIHEHLKWRKENPDRQ